MTLMWEQVGAHCWRIMGCKPIDDHFQPGIRLQSKLQDTVQSMFLRFIMFTCWRQAAPAWHDCLQSLDFGSSPK